MDEPRYVATGTEDALYPQLLWQAKNDNSYNLNINAQHIREFDAEHGYSLYRDMVRYPQEMIPIFDLCVFEVRREPRCTRSCPIKHQRFAYYGARPSECSGLREQEFARMFGEQQNQKRFQVGLFREEMKEAPAGVPCSDIYCTECTV